MALTVAQNWEFLIRDPTLLSSDAAMTFIDRHRVRA